MNASTSGLIQITHIQFLTLLYPSRLEARLIFFLLGPMAIVAAIMQLIGIHDSNHVNEIASAVKNVCNATLSLLFTVALFIWGLLVNRRQAWRTDGGTAVFGASALTLALVSTGLNVLYVDKEEEYVWLPGLMWAVILWQSFLGWWWWVGAGSGSSIGMTDEEEMEEKLRKEAKREGMTGALSRDGEQDDHEGHTTSVRTRSQAGETGNITEHSGTHRRHRRQAPRDRPSSSSPQGSPTPSMTRSVVSTATSVYSFMTLPTILPAVIHKWYASLRRAHRIAARQQDVERVERIRELSTRDTARTGMDGQREKMGKELRERKRDDEDGGSETEMDSGIDHQRRRMDTNTEDHHTHEEGDIDDRIPTPERKNDVFAERTHVLNEPAPAQPIRPRSLWWWGPLFRWRLQDSTVY
ncbi:hypothetical protein BDQ17DRAFT_1344184 [Cyathus striatus]|nr:hypothetical protein BDQ17DRAFT_1344184 [Cyathus striatus]